MFTPVFIPILLAVLLVPALIAPGGNARAKRLAASVRGVLALPGVKKLLPLLAYLQPLILAVITYLVASRFAAIGVDTHADGIIFKPAFDVAEGKMLFRDTYTQYGALTTLLQALALKIFGPGLLVIKLQTAAFYAAINWLLWLIWKRFIPKWLATVCGLICICLSPYFRGILIPWSSVYALFFLALALYSLVLYLERRAWYYMAAAGVSAALTLWCRQPVGFLLFWAVLVFLASMCVLEKPRRKEFLGSAITYISGFAAVNALFLTWLALNGALKDMWRQSVVVPFLWARDLMPDPSLLKHIGTFFMYRTSFDAYPVYVWYSLPLVCLLVFFGTFVNYFRGGSPSLKRAVVFAVVVVCLGSWGQYFPANDYNHVYWAAAPMIGVFAFFVWELFKRGNVPFRKIAVVSAMGLFFQPDVVMGTRAAGIKLRREYVALNYPSVLKGMRVPPRDAVYFKILGTNIDEYFGRQPEGGLINSSMDALFGTFRGNVLNFHPLPVYWEPFKFVYPDYFPRLIEYARSRRPIIIGNRNPAIYDGYTILSLLQDKYMGLSQNLYVSAPGEDGSAWYITAFRSSPADPSVPGAHDYSLDMQYASAHAGAIRSVGVAAFDSGGTLTGGWQPVSRTGNSITLWYSAAATAGRPKPPQGEFVLPSEGKVKLFLTGYNSPHFQPVKLKITTVMDDNTRFERELFFLSQSWQATGDGGVVIPR